MIETDLIVIAVWLASAILIVLNSWELWKTHKASPDEFQVGDARSSWYEVGVYVTPYYAARNAQKLSPLYFNIEPNAPYRWAYADLKGQLIFPTENGVRRRGAIWQGTPLIE